MANKSIGKMVMVMVDKMGDRKVDLIRREGTGNRVMSSKEKVEEDKGPIHHGHQILQG